MKRELNIYLNHEYIGKLIEKNGQNLHLIYDEFVTTPISISMPISNGKYYNNIVFPFFENLLPEGVLRRHISQMYRVSENNPFSLLNVIGEDCAGAIRLVSEQLDVEGEPVKLCTEDDLLEVLKRNSEGISSYVRGMRLSLAGAQNKTSRIFFGGEYYYSNNSNPSTHILKFDNSDYPSLLVNEWFCTTLAERMKFPTARMAVKTIDKYSYLSIERFDRKTINGITKRIHQEDFCQILGITSTNKYQAEGGPSLKQVVTIIKKYSSNIAVDLILLAKIVVFNLLIGNADYHGKNLSLQHLGNNKYRLTPFYDLVSTVIYEKLSLDSAMSMNRKYNITKITREDLVEEFNSWDMNGSAMLNLILDDFKNIVVEAELLIKTEEFSPHKEVVAKIVSFLSSQHQRCKL